MNERKRHTRRRILRKAAEASAALTLGGLMDPQKLFAATPGPVVLSATDSHYPTGVNFSYYTNKVLGCWESAVGVPLDSSGWPHQLATLVQDNRGSTQGAEHMHWDLPHKDHRIDFCWKWMAGTATGTLGWLVFREQDAQNFYQVEFRVKGIALVKRVAGVFSDMAFLPLPGVVGDEFMYRLEMIGNTYTLRTLA